MVNGVFQLCGSVFADRDPMYNTNYQSTSLISTPGILIHTIVVKCDSNNIDAKKEERRGHRYEAALRIKK